MRRGFFTKAVMALAVLALVATACERGGGDQDGGDNGNGNTQAQPETSLLETVQENGTLRCGVNNTVPGFGFTPEGGTDPEGFDIDFCRAFAAAILGDPEAIELIPIDAEQRFAALQDGQYDVLVRNTTWTSSRDGSEGVAFAHVNFYDGQAMMVRADSGFQEIADMDGARVCVTQGTTTESNLADYAAELGISLEPVTFETNDDILPAFVGGRCDGWTSDASQLAGLRSNFPEDEGGPEALVILPELMSKEPLAPAVLDGDTEFYDAINWTVHGVILAEEYGVSSENVQDEFDNPSTPQIAAMLGAPFAAEEGEEPAALDSGLGLDVDFMVDVLGAVGNYGEIFERHIGEDTPLGLERGLNALWTDDGLQYAPPFR